MRSIYYVLYYTSYGWHIFAGLVGCFVLGILLAHVVGHGRTRHLRWIVPMLLGSALSTIYGVVEMVGVVFRLRSYFIFISALVLADIASVLFTIGLIMLVRSVMSGAQEGNPPPQPPAYPPGSWPPPPTTPR